MRILPYLPPERHGVIGDRQSAATVAVDGTLDWLCLPRYDADVVFGALLDADHGGSWRFGPHACLLGSQHYVGRTWSLVTRWATEGFELDLTDTMLADAGDLPRAVVRQLHCLRGTAKCVLDIDVRSNFCSVPSPVGDGTSRRFSEPGVALQVFGPLAFTESPRRIEFLLADGESAHAVLMLGPGAMTLEDTQRAVARTERYWSDTCSVHYTGPRRERVIRSALLVHLLSYAPSGAVIAAPTTSMPERIGGDWNADYRFAWIRDASLSLASLAALGDTSEAPVRYMDWLARLEGTSDAPLQVLYRVDGDRDIAQHEVSGLSGYRGSTPLRFGNHAYTQRQLDAFGFLCDCVHIYLQEGGPWKKEYWRLVKRAADHIVATWREPDNGLWELDQRRHYVSGKVMAWVGLDRAVKIAERVGREGDAEQWRHTMPLIHDEVMQRGWSDALQSFTQHYEDDALDSSVLLISVMEFLPPDHPRVLSTITRIEAELAVDGFVYRFDPRRTLGERAAALGEHEAAFLPSTFWLATALAKAGQPGRAERILERAEAVAGEQGWFGEAIDPRSMTFRGNFPLLFSQIEYVRAVMEIAKQRPLEMAAMAAGKVASRIEHALHAGGSN